MDVHEQERQRHIAWFNKHISKREKPQTWEELLKEMDNSFKVLEERTKEVTPENAEEHIIQKHRSENLISMEVEITLTDVLFDNDVISYDEYKKRKGDE
jgi:hypothetical protein